MLCAVESMISFSYITNITLPHIKGTKNVSKTLSIKSSSERWTSLHKFGFFCNKFIMSSLHSNNNNKD